MTTTLPRCTSSKALACGSQWTILVRATRRSAICTNSPFDKIKIDQSFVRELSARPEAKAIIRAITGLGVSLGIHHRRGRGDRRSTRASARGRLHGSPGLPDQQPEPGRRDFGVDCRSSDSRSHDFSGCKSECRRHIVSLLYRNTHSSIRLSVGRQKEPLVMQHHR